MGQRGRLVAGVALVDFVLLVAAVGVGLSHLGDDSRTRSTGPESDIRISGEAAALPAPGPVRNDAVRARPWPSRATPTGPWSATLAAKGNDMDLTTPGRVVGGIRHASISYGPADPRVAGDTFLLPDGSSWSPQGRIQLEGPDDLPFRSAKTYRQALTVETDSFEAVLASADNGVTAVGVFVRSDGQRVDRLPLPPGTRRVTGCAAGSRCSNQGSPPPLQLQVASAPGLSIHAAGNGEAAVAGTAKVTALDRNWDGLVAAVEAEDLRVAATFNAGHWTVTATGHKARQVWIDVWPVIDGELSAKGVVKKPSFFHPFRGDKRFPLRIQWKNVGHATTYIHEAQGVGPGAKSIGFDLEISLGHDAGLNVSRARKVVNLKDGATISAELLPGKSVDRGLSYQPGADATIVLRGNFPTATVPLPVPATAPES